MRADRTGLPSPEDQELYVQALGTLEQARDAKAADAAIERFRELLETAPDSPLVHASLGRAYYVKFGLTMDRQWLDRASRAARRAVALDPDAPETLVTLGMVETIHGNYGQAVASFERALTLQPTSAIAAIGLGQAFIAERRYDDAERMYRRAIGLNPAWWQGHHELANLFWFRKRYDDALREYNEVIRLDPDRSTGYTGKGAVLLIKERLPEAAQAFRKALSLNEDASALANLTYCQFYSGEYDQAVETIRRALRLQPTRSHFWAYLAEASASSSRYRGEKARAYRTAAERARAELAINSDYARSHATLAVALAHAGDFKGARRSIARAREIAPDTATHLFNAARIANLAGDSAESVALLKQALERGTPRIEVERHPEFQNLRESGALRDVLRPPA